jgi:protease I
MGKKNIVMVVAHKDFRDEEYFIPLDIFRSSSFEVVTASSIKGEVLGVMGGEAVADARIQDINTEDFEAIVLIGGGGAQEYFKNEDLHKIIREFYEQDKVVGAICIAPVILAKSGILKGKKATVWTSSLDKLGRRILEQNGCTYSDNDLEVDGKIVTANGPKVAEKFAEEVVSLLLSEG